MNRIYGHLVWGDRRTGETTGTRTLCGKRRISRNRRQPFVMCARCTAVMIDGWNAAAAVPTEVLAEIRKARQDIREVQATLTEVAPAIAARRRFISRLRSLIGECEKTGNDALPTWETRQ